MSVTVAILHTNAQAGNHPKVIHRLRLLIIGPTEEATNDDTPVLLYLHGKGEASIHFNQISRICDHLPPPFQAWTGRLKGVTVVAPQAPPLPNGDWNWRYYVPDLAKLLSGYAPRPIFATGFSRGGLGVLQLVAEDPKLIKRWAIIDAQPAEGSESAKIAQVLGVPGSGWVRYGTYVDDPEKPERKPFAQTVVASSACRQNAGFLKYDHGTMALLAYCGDPLGSGSNLYDFLSLRFDRWSRAEIDELLKAPDVP